MTASGPVAFVTGGADRIGRALALHLAACGYDVGVHYHRSAAQAEAATEMIRAAGRRAVMAQADFTDAKGAREAFAKTAKALGPVSLLVHAASRFVREPFEAMGEQELSLHWQINVATPLLITEDFAAQVVSKNTQNAQAIFLSDALNGYSISCNYFAYALSKRALEAAVPMLALRLAPGVRINALAPGYVLRGAEEGEKAEENIRVQIPMQSPTSLSDITGAIDFLLASESVTGEVIRLAGGRHLHATER